MAQLKLKDRPGELQEQVERSETVAQEEVNLSGTLASVTVLGLFIIISWLGVWALFMIR